MVDMSDDAPPWTARYYQHSNLKTQQFGSLIAAVEFLSAGLESNLASPDAIIGPDGAEAYRFGLDDEPDVWGLREQLHAEAEGTDPPN